MIEREDCEQKSAIGAKFTFGVSWHVFSHGLVDIHQPMLSVGGLVSLYERDCYFDIYLVVSRAPPNINDQPTIGRIEYLNSVSGEIRQATCLGWMSSQN